MIPLVRADVDLKQECGGRINKQENYPALTMGCNRKKVK